jgi:hypothetical protein
MGGNTSLGVERWRLVRLDVGRRRHGGTESARYNTIRAMSRECASRDS